MYFRYMPHQWKLPLSDVAWYAEHEAIAATLESEPPLLSNIPALQSALLLNTENVDLHAAHAGARALVICGTYGVVRERTPVVPPTPNMAVATSSPTSTSTSAAARALSA